MKCVHKLAPALSEMYRSPCPSDTFVYSPGICTLENGRLIGTCDIMGAGTARLEGAVTLPEIGTPRLGKIFVSDDKGESWQFRANFPFIHARPFVAGKSIYVLGHNGNLMIVRSDDGGETWSDAVVLSQNEIWHQAPANVCYANGCIYLVMEKRMYKDCHAWEPSVLAPVLMRGAVDADLTKRENWTFASAVAFRDLVDPEQLHYIAVPFWRTERNVGIRICEGKVSRKCDPIGWLETNVVRFEDPDHLWYDKSGHTFHLWMRTHTGGTGYAAVMKVVERADGSMETMMETLPSGKKLLYVPFPGGQMKFHILYDAVSKLYWLLGTQATDSMIRPERMPEGRFGIPNNERQRLVLHFSKNCVDWCFAGLVDAVDGLNMSRHYASMTICGEDLIILSRSGDENASTAHNGNVITCHRISEFRDLIY